MITIPINFWNVMAQAILVNSLLLSLWLASKIINNVSQAFRRPIYYSITNKYEGCTLQNKGMES